MRLVILSKILPHLSRCQPQLQMSFYATVTPISTPGLKPKATGHVKDLLQQLPPSWSPSVTITMEDCSRASHPFHRESVPECCLIVTLVGVNSY